MMRIAMPTAKSTELLVLSQANVVNVAFMKMYNYKHWKMLIDGFTPAISLELEI